MRKRKDKNKIREMVFAVGIVMVIAIVGIGATNMVKGEGVFGKTIRITMGDKEIVIGEDDISIDVKDEESIFGGIIHNVQEDFSEGISVDGTEVITGAGLWTGRILATTSPSTIATFGTNSQPGCLILGGTTDTTSALYYITVESGVLTTTGGASDIFTVPGRCITE